MVDILPGQRHRLQLDALLAAMTDPVLAVDGNGRVLLANPALVALYGEEPAGITLAQLTPDEALYTERIQSISMIEATGVLAS